MKTRMKIALAAIAALFAAVGTWALPAKRETFAAESAELFLPGSYEEYLPLRRASDAAVSGERIAAADGNILYVFDRAAGKYSRYEHVSGSEALNISRLQFTADGELYFSDQNADLYHFEFQNLHAQIQDNIPCATFVISGNYLYTTSVVSGMTTFYVIPYYGGGNLGSSASMRKIAELTSSTNTTPTMFVYQASLHCAVGNHLYVYTETDGKYVLSEQLLSHGNPVTDLSSVCVMGGTVYYSVNGSIQNEDDGIYRADFSSDSTRLTEESGIVSLTSNGERLYAVTNTSVRELTVGESGELLSTGYEIASASSSNNRLSGAVDAVRAGDLIVTADAGNDRVSVYDRSNESFTLLPCTAVSHVATDGTVIAASAAEKIFLYRRGSDEPYLTYVASSEVKGLAVVYGSCYFVTGASYGLAAENGQEIMRTLTFPTALTSDLYGNLYVADQSNAVVKFSESEFLHAESSGAAVSVNWTLPTEYASLRADYEGNLYYLTSEGVWKNGVRLGETPGKDLVYGNNTNPVSFALGFEDNGVYLLYGDFFAYSKALPISNLSQIDTENAFERLQEVPASEEIFLLDVPEGATGISVDLVSLKEESETFAYTGHERTEGGRGVLLCRIERFCLISLYRDYSYETMLFPAELCTSAPLNREDVPSSPRYLTNEAAFLRYPCIVSAVTVTRLPRLTEVTLLAELHAEDGKGFAFGYVETKEGERGYVPLGYLTANIPFGNEPESYTIGYLKANADGVTFRADDGNVLTITERKRVKIYDGGDGRCFVRFEQNGVEYTAQVTRSMIETGNPNALRMSGIIILCVILVGIVAAYVLFVPKKKKK